MKQEKGFLKTKGDEDQQKKGSNPYPSKIDIQKQKDKEDRGDYGNNDDVQENPAELEDSAKEYFIKQKNTLHYDTTLT